MVFLGRTALNTAASSFDLPVPDWTGYWELQLHYDLRGSGEIKLSFNDGEAYYVSALGSTGNGHRAEISAGDLRDRGDRPAAVRRQRPAGLLYQRGLAE